jgi:hypothetical protein
MGGEGRVWAGEEAGKGALYRQRRTAPACYEFLGFLPRASVGMGLWQSGARPDDGWQTQVAAWRQRCSGGAAAEQRRVKS